MLMLNQLPWSSISRKDKLVFLQFFYIEAQFLFGAGSQLQNEANSFPKNVSSSQAYGFQEETIVGGQMQSWEQQFKNRKTTKPAENSHNLDSAVRDWLLWCMNRSDAIGATVFRL